MDELLYINFIVALWTTAITTFLLGFFILSKDKRSLVNRVFFFYSFSIFFWSFSEIWGIACTQKMTALIWTRVEQVGVFFIPTLFVHFVFSLLQINNRKWILKTAYFLSALFGILSATPFMIADSVPVPSIPYVRRFGTPGVVYHFAILYFVGMVIYGLYQLYKAYGTSIGVENSRLKYVFWGSVFGYLGGASNFLLVYGIGVPFLTPFGTYALPVYVGVIAYAIVRYRLMDIRVVAVRTLIFSFVYVPILAVPFLIGYFLDLSWVIPTILETIFAPVGLFVYLKIQERAERKILQKEYSLASEIRDLSSGLMKLDDVRELSRLVIEGLKNITKTESVSLYILQENRTAYFMSHSCGEQEDSRSLAPNNPLIEYFQKHPAPVMSHELESMDSNAAMVLKEKGAIAAVPAVEKKTLMGIIFIGEKPDNSPYSQIELAALEVLARQVAFSVQVIQFIEEKEEIQRARNEMQRMKEFEYLTSAIGHEIGNGIQAIELASSVLVRKQDLVDMFAENKKAESFLKEQVGNIKSNIENIRQVSEALKGYIHKGDTGQKQEVSLHELLERVLVLAKVRNRGMKEMNVQLEGEARVICNPPALQSVFSNLINNCYDAIIQERTYRQEHNHLREFKGSINLNIQSIDDIIKIYLRDNGIGMSEEVKEQIFIPLFTTKSHEKKKDKRLTGGTGIGMFTIQKMLASQGGHIEVHNSVEHGGAEFLIVISGGGEC